MTFAVPTHTKFSVTALAQPTPKGPRSVVVVAEALPDRVTFGLVGGEGLEPPTSSV
jgi:hypothetical protein